MTIAACYVSDEGVVLGADSTVTTIFNDPPGMGMNHLNHTQKIFEIGEHSTLGIVTWGLGGLVSASYRSLFADLGADIVTKSCNDVTDVANCFIQEFWTLYNADFSSRITTAQTLAAKKQGGAQLSDDEERELLSISNSLTVGFCLGGRYGNDRSPAAFEIVFSPTSKTPPAPTPIPQGDLALFGCSIFFEKVRLGIDSNTFYGILNSGKWGGTHQELLDIVRQNAFQINQRIPIREAVDLVHFSVYATVKCYKFFFLPPVCGGPVEVAVITSDRNFRWVKHKRLDQAIQENVL